MMCVRLVGAQSVERIKPRGTLGRQPRCHDGDAQQEHCCPGEDRGVVWTDAV
jgi:hypothetical protein